MAENQDVVEYCVTRLENLLSNCVNLFEVIDRGLYNHLINVVHMFFLLHSYAVSQVEESRANSAYIASINCSNIGRPRYAIMFAQLSYLVGENFNTRRIANCLGVSVSTVRWRLCDNGIDLDQTYSQISDVDLDQLIWNIQLHFPRIGCRWFKNSTL